MNGIGLRVWQIIRLFGAGCALVAAVTRGIGGEAPAELAPAAANQPGAAVTNAPAAPSLSLGPGSEPQERFYEWLRSLGADSNRVDAWRQNLEVSRLYRWLEDHSLEKGKPVRLFNGRDLGAFYSWIEKDGVYADRLGVFSVTNGMLRISGQRQGYLATRLTYSDYRLVAEYKWGTLTWGTRKERARNSGISVHGVGLDGIPMKSIEIQIAEGQTGDVVVLGGAKLTAAGGATKSRSYDTFLRPGNLPREDKLGFHAKGDLEKPHGEWNTLEIICQAGFIKLKVNGQPVFEGQNATPNAGRILLQSNGAEIFFRRLDLYPLNPLNCLPAEK